MASARLYRRAIPAAARFTTWNAPDGWPMRRFDWPAAGKMRGAILFQGGRGDIVEKYLELFAHWHRRGWSITWFDWRGQGGSGRLTESPITGDIDDFATYTADFAAFHAEWVAATPGPHVLMGHSMGGHIILRCVVEAAVRPQALVLVAPMLGIRTPFGAWLGERIARMIGGSGDPGRAAWKGNEKPGATVTREALLTHDRDRYGDELFWQAAQPTFVTGPPSWRWVTAAFASTRQIRGDARLKSIDLPVLMLLPMADALVDARAALAVANRLPDVRIERFGKEAAHEVLREVDPVRDRAIAAIDDFLTARVTG